ncbi:MAG: 50S ribosome-binding GTPase [Phycisphaerales bacterium]|nr:MAG: 50S ribosome-binding GTPase [Phycisphaerales bacterium]
MRPTNRNQAHVLTPPGTGAIALIRVKGPDALSLVSEAFRPGKGSDLSRADGSRLRYGRFVDGGEVIDDVVVSLAAADGAEIDIASHGGVRVIERVLLVLERRGVHIVNPTLPYPSVWPTENLIAREAIAAMSRAKTVRAVRFLAWQREYLAANLRRIEALIRSDRAQAARQLEALIVGYDYARILIDGARVALIGPANSGKSTLFNRLLGRTAAIVSSRTGTTRDWVTGSLDVEGIPLELIDTAGCNAQPDESERPGIEAGIRATGDADLRLLLLDGSEPLPCGSGDVPMWWQESDPAAIVATKLDKGAVWPDTSWLAPGKASQPHLVRVSAESGEGCEGLVEHILGLLGVRGRADNIPCLFTLRQSEAAASVRATLDRGGQVAENCIEERLISE